MAIIDIDRITPKIVPRDNRGVQIFKPIYIKKETKMKIHSIKAKVDDKKTDAEYIFIDLEIDIETFDAIYKKAVTVYTKTFRGVVNDPTTRDTHIVDSRKSSLFNESYIAGEDDYMQLGAAIKKYIEEQFFS